LNVENARRRRASNHVPRKAGEVVLLACVDCRSPFEWVVKRGTQPERCIECKHQQMLALSRKNSKARRERINAAKPPKTCVVCGTEFRSGYGQKIVCSDECRDIDRRQKHNELRRKARADGAGWYVRERDRVRRRYQDDAEWRDKERERARTFMNAKYAADPEWREKVIQKEREVRATGKYRDTERARYRRKYDEDPNFRVKFFESTHRRRARRYKVFKQATVRVGPVDGLECSLCGAPAAAWDHVVPILIGGPHIDANLRPICQSCNSRRPKLGNDVTEGDAARALTALLEVAEEERDDTWELSAWACAEIIEGRLPPPIKVDQKKRKRQAG